ncbi:polysaccharide synthesis protein GtrA [Pseudomonas sp. ICMP22404]|uniref:GtrA family protein n=1 Tax=Pseudomonas TaxID=286 RepID=UPI00111B9339|nr:MULTISPECIES: GtrA family protein [Pseudomonas]MCI0995247.1 GtrA family protein [Pseudomonas corrugata]NUT64154.1 polysaccharide synthesis protein GtrA [Pseudomonas corrugata]TNF83006.1 polysaccharide synthesis protein GtrA [Pseudomonas sp. ICMP22404]
MKGFSALMVIGLANGLIHWQVFFVLRSAVGLSQAVSNLTAFCVATAFSFYVNALYIFEPGAPRRGYLPLTAAMAGLSYGIGAAGDTRNLPGWVALVSFSLLNLAIGYSFFRFVVFRDRHQV